MRAQGRHGPGQRQLRVGEIVRRELAQRFTRDGLGDPAFERVSLTVAEVRMSADLRSAVVFVLPLGGARGEAVIALLNREAAKYRGLVGRAAGLRFAPALRFCLDVSLEHARRIESLLAQGKTLQEDG